MPSNPGGGRFRLQWLTFPLLPFAIVKAVLTACKFWHFPFERNTMRSSNSKFGNDTPMGRPGEGDSGAVFVPATGREGEAPASIKNGAGMVGYGNSDGTLTVYFESNRFDDAKLQKWEDKVRIAYERIVKATPTSSHITVVSDWLEQIGTIGRSGIHIRKPESLTRWLTHCNVMASAPTSDHVK